MPEVLLVIGTRPEAIKLLPVYRALRARGADVAVVTTGQHTGMLDPLMEALGFPVSHSLDLGGPPASLAALSARLLTSLDGMLEVLLPKRVVVQGDTTSAAMGALAAYYRDIRVAHVEAGLRTGRPREPFPEELNRQVVARIADLHFAPTSGAQAHLRREGIEDACIHVVGNTIVDALRDIRERVLPFMADDAAIRPILASSRPLLLVTAHRRENHGAGLDNLAAALKRLAVDLDGKVEIAFPLHLNPAASVPVRRELEAVTGVHLLPPLLYPQFLKLLTRASVVLTDSGGVQEECAALGTPLLIARNVTERSEVIECGVGELVGLNTEVIHRAALRLLTDEGLRASRAKPSAAFGDGHAGARIAALLQP